MMLRKLSEQGLKTFREFLADARGSVLRPPDAPKMLLALATTSEEIAHAPELDPFFHPRTNYELAIHLHAQFVGIDASVVEGSDGRGDPGFWGAVALFYFDLLTPGYPLSQKELKADNCYIPGSVSEIQLGRYFRHRIAGPYRLYKLYGEHSEPFLLSPPGEQNALYNKITDTAFYTETRCIVEAINLLYFDARKRDLKPGWNAKDGLGTLPRLLAVVDQFDLTYDLLGIEGKTLLEQLPEEFDPWRPGI